MKNLCPDELQLSVHQIDYERLWQEGYRALIFDIDNTLGAWGCPELDQKTCDLLAELDSRGFRLSFLSNDGGANRPRLKAQLASWLLLWGAKKPCTNGYCEILQMLQCDKAVMIGDQLFTDVWGAKRAGLYAILVAPVSPQTDSIWAKLRRPVERWVLKLLAAQRPS